MSKLQPLFNDLESKLHKIYDLKKQRQALLDPRVPSELNMVAEVDGEVIEANVEKGWLCAKLQKDIDRLIEESGKESTEALRDLTCEENSSPAFQHTRNIDERNKSKRKTILQK